jgi:ABC-type oligopeptide transport system ATPase subunit
MRFPFEIISGEMLLDSLFNNNLITQGQHDKINKHYEDSRNENNYTLIIIDEIFELLDESQHADVKKLIQTKGQVEDFNYCYIAI